MIFVYSGVSKRLRCWAIQLISIWRLHSLLANYGVSSFHTLRVVPSLRFWRQQQQQLSKTAIKNTHEQTRNLLRYRLWSFWSMCTPIPKGDFNISPVHVVLVSLLVDQLSSLFLPFFSLREFLVRLRFFWSTKKSEK